MMWSSELTSLPLIHKVLFRTEKICSLNESKVFFNCMQIKAKTEYVLCEYMHVRVHSLSYPVPKCGRTISSSSTVVSSAGIALGCWALQAFASPVFFEAVYMRL